MLEKKIKKKTRTYLNKHVELKKIFFYFYLFLRDRERQRMRGEGQGARETQNPKQAPGSELSVQSPTRGLDPRAVKS